MLFPFATRVAMPLTPVLAALLLVLVSSPADAEQQAASIIPRSASSVDIQLCVLSGFLLPTQRTEFQQVLLTHLQTQILSDTGVYLERQYTTLTEGNLCYLCVYQAPTTDYAVYAVKKFAALPSQLLYIPFTFSTTAGVSVQIPCKVDAALWSGDDLTYLGTPFPVKWWKVNDLLLWGSSLVSLLFVCLSSLCCYALCTQNLGNNTKYNSDHDNGVVSFKKKDKSSNSSNNGKNNNVVKMDKKILSTLTQQQATSTSKSTLPVAAATAASSSTKK